jgi:hypothetical protein
VAVVHNGIIENFAALRTELEERGHGAGAVDVRVRVAVVGSTVGGPAGMAEAGGALRERRLGERLAKSLEFSGAALGRKLPVGDHPDARGVIAAILQPPQPIHDDVESLARSDIPHNSAHKYSE